MHKHFKAKTLEEAYENATANLGCSINALNIEIVQQASKGFFGFFAKEVIIKVSMKNSPKNDKKPSNIKKPKSNNHNKESISNKKIEKNNDNIPQVQGEKIFNDFYSSKDTQEVHNNISIKKDDDTVILEIQTKINNLFSNTCYKLEAIHVCFYDNDTVYIEFKGEDAALLIGKEGYRYKALSYILFNWIHEKYNFMLRLEVAQFLTTQEEAIHNYLIPVIETIKNDGFYKTKPLDGVLVHIALKKLRDEFPQKYVAVKTNIKGDKYILVNEYRK